MKFTKSTKIIRRKQKKIIEYKMKKHKHVQAKIQDQVQYRYWMKFKINTGCSERKLLDRIYCIEFKKTSSTGSEFRSSTFKKVYRYFLY